MAQAQIKNVVPLYPASEPRQAGEGGARARYRNVGRGERWASAVGGALMALAGLRRGRAGGLVLAAAGGALLYRGLSGHCPVFARLGLDTAPPGRTDPHVDVREVLTVYAPRPEVYARWLDLEGLPRFMHHLDSVKVLDARHSHWEARLPGGVGTVGWDAELVEDVPGERLSWCSLPGADLHNAGTVRFEDAMGGVSTVVYVNITYRPPAGDVGAALARFVNPSFARMIREDVRRFRSFVEASADAGAEAGALPVAGPPAGG